MRTPQLIAALALAAGAVVPVVAAAPAHAMAGSCVVTLYDIELSNPRENDGRDELRFKVDGNWYPNNGHVEMSSTTWDRNPEHFGHPSMIILRTENKSFDLREVDPPIITGGDSLGEAWAHGYVCDDLSVGETTEEMSVLSSSKHDYTVWLRLTGQ
ncbi:hypothetical protein [Nonomuraea sp. NPDC050202]|jgi:hypothetical protein|uniref:hypothetical protein n=1 Tax=unclassified Nonomuraea TaxID=2593643 RepID=UPI0033D2E001